LFSNKQRALCQNGKGVRKALADRKGAPRTITITLQLTPKQVESLLAQLAGAEADWMDDPAFIRWLAKRNEQVSAELQKGEYATLEELQEKWVRKESAK
jgi:hypothetical protein